MLPTHLIEQIKSKNVILFLGSGASLGAVSRNGSVMPTTQELADLISKKYLGREFQGQSLSRVAELAINESSVTEFQSFIHDLFDPFNPTEYHNKIPLFPWNQILTTNYDLIIERAYRNVKERVQDLIPLFKNTPQYQIKRTEKTLLYLKLHGSIDYINDPDCPLIFTPEQYLTHTNKRERLFSRFYEEAQDFPILFIGQSLNDIDLRYYLHELDGLRGAKPMSYLVAPSLTELDIKLWQSRRISCIKLSLHEFLEELEKAIDKPHRVLGGLKLSSDTPIFEKFQVDVNNVTPTEDLISFINNDVEYVNRNIGSPVIDSKVFYRGYFDNWDPILKNLDVKRTISDAILFEVFLDEVQHSSSDFYFYLIKGNAGSGKSVLLKRIAFEASTELNRLCIFFKPYVIPRFEPLYELYTFCKERIYVFLDNVSIAKNELVNIIEKVRKSKIPITFITGERINIWNVDCEELHSYLTEDFQIKYLNDKEINELLTLLEKHHALGSLQYKSETERIESLREKAGRELLVALYEATNSKPFEEIIYDEYKTINNPIAQSLYLTISILHRLGAETRAGLISRVHGIGFHEFKEKFFSPLEYIVFTRKNPRIDDFVYLTRHKQIAEIIFSTVLQTPQERFDEYSRIIANLNIDYDSDRQAFYAMTNARQLISLFPDPLMVRNFYDLAQQAEPDEPMIFQQRGIYEMNSHEGNLKLAEKYLNAAREEGKFNAVVEHSLIELTLKKAMNSRYDHEFFHYVDDVISSSKSLISKYPNQVHAFHTILKAINAKLERVIEKSDEPSIERILKDAERYFLEGKQLFPDNEFILEAESRLNETINRKSNAVAILKSAFEHHKASPFITLRYCNLLEETNQIDTAIQAVKESLDINPQDKDLNFKLAELYSKHGRGNLEEILHYLRRSFTNGDSRFNAQFWYARALYLNNQPVNAKEIFAELSKARIDPFIKNKPRGRVKVNSSPAEYDGEISKLFYNYGFIRRFKFGDSIYFHKNDIQDDSIAEGDRVRFELAFNYKGPIATHMKVNK